jgi:hypothetical protein
MAAPTGPAAKPSKLDYIRAWSDLALFLPLVLGILVGLFLGWRAGAVVALIALCASLALHVMNGLIEYRRVMRRPWPQVEPLDDDDDD